MKIQDFRHILELEADKTMKARNLDSKADINNGFCSDFARSVLERVRLQFGDEYTIWRSDNDTPIVEKHSYGSRSSVSASHVWLEYKELNFDAECIEGVNNPSNLPLFERNGVKNPKE